MAGGTVGVLAGNSRASVSATSEVTIEPQLAAFRGGLERTAALRAAGVAVSVSLAMDHRGRFEDRYLVSGLGVVARRRPRLADLLPPLRAPFEPICTSVGIAMDGVRVLSEGTARLRGEYVARSAPPELRPYLQVDTDGDDEPSSCGVSGCSGTTHVTCAAVAFAYFERAAAGCTHLDVYWEDAPWSRRGVVQRGAVLTRRLGHTYTLRCVRVAAAELEPPGGPAASTGERPERAGG